MVHYYVDIKTKLYREIRNFNRGKTTWIMFYDSKDFKNDNPYPVGEACCGALKLHAAGSEYNKEDMKKAIIEKGIELMEKEEGGRKVYSASLIITPYFKPVNIPEEFVAGVDVTIPMKGRKVKSYGFNYDSENANAVFRSVYLSNVNSVIRWNEEVINSIVDSAFSMAEEEGIDHLSYSLFRQQLCNFYNITEHDDDDDNNNNNNNNSSRKNCLIC